MESPQPTDLFVSYQGSDQDFAARLAAAVEESDGGGLRVFYAPWDIRPGANIVAELDRALQKARYVGVVLSPEYLKADWTAGESSAAIFADPSGRLGKVIPIMHRHCQPPPLLRFRRYIDFEALGFDIGVAQLVAVLRGKPLPRGRSETTNAQRNHRQGGGIEATRAHLDAAAPDAIADLLYPNIFPVSNTPKYVWSAPTRLRKGRDLFQYYGPDRQVPPFILAEDRLLTFADLSAEGHPFTGVVEEYDANRETWSSWVQDQEKAKRLHWLLDDCLRQRTRALRLRYEKRGKKFYYEKGVLKEQKFRAFARGKGKDFVLDYSEKGGNFVAHRAVNLRFILLGADPFLRVESGWVFTDALGEVIEGRRRTVLNSRFTSGQRNAANFNEVRFWLWFLAGDEEHLKLSIDKDRTLDVKVALDPIQVPFGILGDARVLSEIQAAPDVAFEDEDDEEAGDDGSLESFDEEGDS